MENNIIHVTKGIVVIKNILSLDEQLMVIDIIERNGKLKDENGNWNFKNHKGEPLRGREHRRLTYYPQNDAIFLLDISKRFKDIAESIDETLSFSSVTHMLTLWYPTAKGGGWHKDGNGGGSSDGDTGAPVFSLTIGNTCKFKYQLVGTKTKETVILNSGDIIIFGGPQREMYHSAASIEMGTFTDKQNFNARINLTFRTCTNFDENDEANAQTENYNKRAMDKYTT